MLVTASLINSLRNLGRDIIVVSSEDIPDAIVVDGVKRPTRNSDNKLIYHSVEGIANFWRWFGDSRVVDVQGRPQVVYHGTDKDFSSFNPDLLGKLTNAESARLGFFFTSSAKNSSFYAGFATNEAYRAELEADLTRLKAEFNSLNQTITEAARKQRSRARSLSFTFDPDWLKSDNELAREGYSYADIEELRKEAAEIPASDLQKAAADYAEHKNNIAQLNDRIKKVEQEIEDTVVLLASVGLKRDLGGVERLQGKLVAKNLKPNIMPVYLQASDVIVYEQQKEYKDYSYASLLSQAIDSGKDGVIIKNTEDPLLSDIFVVFNPSQIKSAIGNNGSFSHDSTDVTAATR